jgi:hypothetical protein
VIPVTPKPEPGDFDQKVRQKGTAWLQANNLPQTELPPYWRDCLGDLHREYAGICAYISVYIEPVTGTRTADHFIAKSSDPNLAYEWDNYRLACGLMNSRKRDFDDVLDPFELEPETFRLVLYTGQILPVRPPDSPLWGLADATIRRLRLDDDDCRSLRRHYYLDYRQGEISESYLRRRAPFVWQEAQRQGLL